MASKRSFDLGDLIATTGKPKTGFGALGYALAGGDAYQALAQQDAEDKVSEAYARQATGMEAMQKTTRLKSENDARAGLGDVIQGFVNSGQLPKDTDVSAATNFLLSASSSNPAEIGDYLIKLNNISRANQAVTALTHNDPITGNANLAAISGNPIETSKVEGNVVLNPYGAPDQPVVVTPVGKAGITKDIAQAGEAQAQGSAALSRAGTEAARLRYDMTKPTSPLGEITFDERRGLIDPTTAQGGRTKATTQAGQSRVLNPDQAAKLAMAKQGIQNVDQVEKILFDPQGNFRHGIAASINAPVIGALPFDSRAKEGRALILNAVEARLRAESGAAVPEQEVKRAAERFFPGVTDTADSARLKLKQLRDYLSDVVSMTGQSPAAAAAAPAPDLPAGMPEAAPAVSAAPAPAASTEIHYVRDKNGKLVRAQ